MTLTKFFSFQILLIALIMQGCANTSEPGNTDSGISEVNQYDDLDFTGEVVRVSFRFENKDALKSDSFSDEERQSIKGWLNDEVFSGEGTRKYIVNLDFVEGKSDCKNSSSGTGIGGAMAKMASVYTEGVINVSLKQIRPIKQEINAWQTPYMDIKGGVPGTLCKFEDSASKYRAKESLIEMLQAQFLLLKGEVQLSEVERIHKEMITPKGASTGDKVFQVLGHTFGRFFTAGGHIIDGLASFEDVDLSYRDPYNPFDPRNKEQNRRYRQQLDNINYNSSKSSSSKSVITLDREKRKPTKKYEPPKHKKGIKVVLKADSGWVYFDPSYVDWKAKNHQKKYAKIKRAVFKEASSSCSAKGWNLYGYGAYASTKEHERPPASIKSSIGLSNPLCNRYGEGYEGYTCSANILITTCLPPYKEPVKRGTGSVIKRL